MLMRGDDVLEIEARIALETDDKQQIYMMWKGFRHGPKEVIDRLNRGDTVDPETYYFRTTPFFETSSEKYGWMNRETKNRRLGNKVRLPVMQRPRSWVL
jgi:hypothetical protein